MRVAAQTALVADHHVEFALEGQAVEHAFPDGKTSNGKSSKVTMSLGEKNRTLHLQVRDNGMGLPEGFSIQKTRSLGLSITRSLVELNSAVRST